MSDSVSSQPVLRTLERSISKRPSGNLVSHAKIPKATRGSRALPRSDTSPRKGTPLKNRSKGSNQAAKTDRYSKNKSPPRQKRGSQGLPKKSRPTTESPPLGKRTRDDGDAVHPTNSSDCNISSSKKRKVAKFEKLKFRNPAAEFVATCNRLYSGLINSKGDPKDDVHQKVQELLDFIDQFDTTTSEAFLGKARLRSVNRCLQMCLKLASPKQRDVIAERFTGNFAIFATQSSTMHLCSKLLRYTSLKFQRQFMEEILARANSSADFILSKNASKVIAHMIEGTLPPFPASEFRKRILASICIPKSLVQQNTLSDSWKNDHSSSSALKIYETASDTGKTLIKAHLESVILKSVDKELADRVQIHSAVELFLKFTSSLEERQAILGTLQECLWHFLSSRAGCSALCTLLDYADAKARKKFIQSWKTNGVAVVDVARNPVSYIVLLKLLSVVDDTKLLKESILSPLLNLQVTKGAVAIKANASGLGSEDKVYDVASELLRDKVSRKCLLLILAERSEKFLSEVERKVISSASPFSKKDNATRVLELHEFLLPAISAIFKHECRHLDGKSFLTRWLQDMGCRDFILTFLSVTGDVGVLDKIQAALEELLHAQALDLIFDDQCAHRALGAILRLDSSTKKVSGDGSKMLRLSSGETFQAFLWRFIIENNLLSQLLKQRGIFVVGDLLRNSLGSGLQSTAEQKQFCETCLNLLPREGAEMSSPSAGVKQLQTTIREVLAA